LPKRGATDLLKGLEKVPSNDDQLLADYVELRCLISRDGEYALADLGGARRRQDDLGVPSSAGLRTALGLLGDGGLFGGAATADEEVPASEGDQAARERAAGASPEDELPEDPETRGREWDQKAQLGQVLVLLRRRERVFGADYPFGFGEGDVLRLKDPLSDGQRLYLFLLTASCHRNIKSGKDRENLTSGFERLAVPVLKGYFGDRLEAFVFGTAAKEGDRYHGGLKKAIRKLAADTGFGLGPKWKKHRKELSESGDRGLDVVGWIPFDSTDAADLRFVVFGQCATGKNWGEKQFDTAVERWGRILHLSGPLTTALLISFSWRGPGGDWHRSLELTTSNIVFDRERIVRLLSGRPIDGLPGRLTNDLLAVADADGM
jgi:hypothetical protein